MENVPNKKCIGFWDALVTSLAPIVVLSVILYMFYASVIAPLITKGEEVADKLLAIDVGSVTADIASIEDQLKGLKEAIDSIEIPTVTPPSVGGGGGGENTGGGSGGGITIPKLPETFVNFFYKR